MRFFRIVFVALIAISATSLTEAQQRDGIPQGIEALRQRASSKTEFTLDHSMLVFAAKLDPDNEDLRRVIAGVSGVSVHDYRFPQRWTYDPETLNSVKEEYHAAGWKQLVNNHGKGGGQGVTDLKYRKFKISCSAGTRGCGGSSRCSVFGRSKMRSFRAREVVAVWG